MNEVLAHAKTLWDYHHLKSPVEKADCIIALGNSDFRTAKHAAKLFNKGMAELLVVTGGFGRLTKESLTKPEAVIFAEIAESQGVPKEKIIIEDASTNTFDNIRFTKNSLQRLEPPPSSFIIVTKPYMERRALETFKSVWPGVTVSVTSPDLSFEAYPNESLSQEHLINMLVGDQQRFMIFSDSGYIETQSYPPEVLTAYHHLIEMGYTTQLIPDENIPNLLKAVSNGESRLNK